MLGLRFSLFSRIILWFFLNLVILAAIFLLIFGLNVRVDQSSIIGGMANRMEAISRLTDSDDEPVRPRLLVRSDSLYGHGLCLDPWPWMAGDVVIIFASIMFWLPLVRNMARSVRQMKGAAEKIDDEDYSIRVDDRRTDEL